MFGITALCRYTWFYIDVVSFFANLRKWTIKFVMFVCPSFRPSTYNKSVPNGQIFWTEELSVFRNSVEKIQGGLKSDKNNSYFAWRHMHSIISRSIRLAIKVQGKGCNENQNRHFMYNNFPFFKIVPLWYNVWNFGIAWQVAGENAIFGHVIQQSQKYMYIYLK
jgi:hypothetical protein